MLYFAYASNLDPELMRQHAPGHQVVGLAALRDHRLAFPRFSPEWGGGLGDSLNLYLEAMSLDDATQLAREAGEHIDEQTAERVARHAGGNPFFIVETTGMLAHVGRDHLPVDTGPLPEALLPPTVQAVIADGSITCRPRRAIWSARHRCSRARRSTSRSSR